MKQKRAYRYRWYPTAEQAQILARTFGCARFVYDWALRLCTDASPKRCSQCGYELASLDLDSRFWLCPQCHSFHDRDFNAAKNVLAAGLAVSARGEAVGPGRAGARSGRAR